MTEHIFPFGSEVKGEEGMRWDGKGGKITYSQWKYQRDRRRGVNIKDITHEEVKAYQRKEKGLPEKGDM
jgi:hypothetical protein